MAKLLHEATKGPDTELLLWNREQEQTSNDIKQALNRVPVLGLPNLRKAFTLYVTEKQKTVLGVLIQKLGEAPQPIGYFSKQLDRLPAPRLACLLPGGSRHIFIDGRSE